MQRDPRAYLHDVRQAAQHVLAFTTGKQFADYERDILLRSAVERQLEIVGEALTQLARVDGDVQSQITEFRRIVGFRNVLAHGYIEVNDQIVWDIIESKLPLLLTEVTALIERD